MRRILITIFLLPVLLLGLPLTGVLIRGENPSPYLAFPPLTGFVRHAPFSWSVFILLALLVVMALIPLILKLSRGKYIAYLNDDEILYPDHLETLWPRTGRLLRWRRPR